MTITANLADGRVLNFPDGTDPAVIQATVKRMVAGDTTEAQPAQRPTGGHSGRIRRRKQQKSERETALQQDIQGIESGEMSAFDLRADGKPAFDAQRVADIQSQRVSEIPELSQTGVSGLADTQGIEGFGTSLAALTALDPAELGNILSTQFPQIGVVTTPDGVQIAVNNETGAKAVLNKEGVSPIDIIQGLGLVGAFLPAGRAASAAPAIAAKLTGRPVASQLGAKVIGGGIASGGIETALQTLQAASGGEFNDSEIALAITLGGAGELAGPAAKSALNKAREILRSGAETAEQRARRELIEQTIGAQPTRAQVTQSPKDFQLQEEIAKGGSATREVLDAQESQIRSKLEQAAERTGGRVATSESTPVNEIVNRSLMLDDQITGLYREAIESAPTEKNITLKGVKNILTKNQGFERKSGGVVSGARQILREKGITLGKPRTVADARSQDVSVATAEDVRQQLNSMFEDSNSTGKRIIRELKNALDDDVFKQVGGDSFEVARTAKREFEQGLNRAKLSKFDSRNKNIVRDLLENKITPDELVEKISRSKTVRAEDVSQLREYLIQTDSGVAAWNDIRAQVLDGITGNIFNEKGVLKPSALGVELDKLGNKARELFTEDEQLLLSNLRKVLKLRIPPPKEAQGLGPSGAISKEVKAKFPLIGPILESLGDYRVNKFMLSLPKRLRETAPFGDINIPSAPLQTTRQEDE